MPFPSRYSASSAATQDAPLSLSSLGLYITIAWLQPEASSASYSVSVTSPAFIVLQSFQAMM
ncbi:hypothetical protein FIU89_19990 [Roseovarius sp. THAF27]|nr:hypothetical protein FIU89_19990 [Roseovarius sp. THAF27]QFT98055.1 hypothetical protein FIU85_12125 [Roseovarius sp. THAF8]